MPRRSVARCPLATDARAPSGPRRCAGARKDSPEHRLGNREYARRLNHHAARLRAAGARPKLEVGSAHDPHEREADELARCALGSSPGPCCAACADDGVLRRSAQRNTGIEAAPPPAAIAGLGRGAPLGRADQRFFEGRLAGDFSGVRVHEGPAAAELADSLGARAFALGEQLVFGRGQYQPRTSSGRRLLAHELAHVKQAERGAPPVIRREIPDAGVPADAGVPYDAGVAPEVDPIAGVAPPPDTGTEEAPPPAPRFDPCSVDVRSLTNAELIHEYRRASAYVHDASHYRRDEFYAYRWLWRQTGEERNRRARAGEAWLADLGITEVPAALVRLEPGPHDSVLIVREPGSAASGAPRSYADVSVVTESQLDTYLARNHVPESTMAEVLGHPDDQHVVDVATAQLVWQLENPQPLARIPQLFDQGFGGMAGALGFGRTPSRLATEIHRGFGVGYDLNYNSLLKYQGAVGEYGFLALDPLNAGPYVDLNVDSGGTARNYDFLQADQRLLPQVKTRYGPSDEPAMTSAYGSGIEDISLNPSSPPREAAVRRFLSQLGSEHGVHLGPWVATAGGRLVVNAEDVPLVRAERVRRIREQGVDYNASVFRGLLWDNSVEHGGQRYTVADFNRDLRTDTVPDAIVERVAQLAGDQVVAGVPGDQVVAVTDLVQSRIASHGSPREAAGSLRPLEIEGALRGVPMGRRAALSGAGGDLLGGALALAVMRARAGMSGQQYPNTWSDDLRGFAVSTPLSAGTAVLGQRLEDQGLHAAMRGLPRSAFTSSAFTRVGLPVITAPVVTMASMGLDSHSYPWQEYAVQSTRATFNALVASGFLATVAAFSTGGAEGGAAVGTVAEPGGGTVVGGVLGWVGGVLLGTGAYLLSDFFIGDTVEDVARTMVGDPVGCPREQ